MAYITGRKHAVAHAVSGTTALSLMTGLALVAPAQAQTPPASSGGTLPEVQVTAPMGVGSDYKVDRSASPKFSQPLLNTTQTITVVPAEVIQEQGGTTLTDALRNVPGVGLFYAGENGNTSTGDAVYMRGFDSSNSIYVDGVRDVGSISRDVFNIEQVEVIEGPSGSDFGRSAPSGSINMVTKQPRLEDSLSGSLGLGSGSYRRGSVDWNKSLDGLGGAAFRLNAMVQDAGVAGRHGVQNDRWGIAPALALGLDTPTRMYFNYLHVDQDNVPDGGVSTIGLPGYTSPDAVGVPGYRGFLDSAAPVDSRNFYGTRSDKDKVTADMLTFRFEHDFAKDTRLTNTLRWGKTRQDYLLTAIMGQGLAPDGSMGGNPLLTPDAADPSTWTLTRLVNTKDVSNKILTNQTNLATSFAIGRVHHDLNTGLELTREEQSNRGLATSGVAPAVSVYHPDSSVLLPTYAHNGADAKGSTSTAALYAFDTLKLGEQWQLNGGLRLDHYKTKYDAMAVCGGRGAPVCGANPPGTLLPSASGLQASGNLFSWKVGALYKPAPNGSIYVNYALSQQPPGGSNFTLSSAANNINNPDMDPQKARTLEIGTKWELLDRRLFVSGALFRTEVSNEIFTDPDGTVSQSGKKRVQGLELSAAGSITPKWGVMAGYTLQSAKVTAGANTANDGSSGLPYTPRSAFTLWSTYRITPQLTLGGGAVYSGGLRRGTDGSVGTPDSTASYWVANAMLSYQINRNADLQLNVYNLFDKDYVAAINKSGYRYFPGVSRSARLTLNVRF